MSVTKRLSYFQNSQNCRVHMHHYRTLVPLGRYFASISNISFQHIMALKKTSVKNIFVIFYKFFIRNIGCKSTCKSEWHRCWRLNKAEGCGTSGFCCLWHYAVQTAELLFCGACAPMNPFSAPHSHFLSKI